MSKKKLLIGLILVVLGGCTFLKSLFAYREAKTNLTTASVSVSGYTRRDGTRVESYHRRPSGGAIHDKPFEDAMLLYSLLMFIGGGLVLFPIGIILSDKASRKFFGGRSLLPKTSVTLKCASRQHTLRLSSDRFWQKTICPICKVPADPTRLRRFSKRLTLLPAALTKQRRAAVSVMLTLLVCSTFVLIYRSTQRTDPVLPNAELRAETPDSSVIAAAQPVHTLSSPSPSIKSSPAASLSPPVLVANSNNSPSETTATSSLIIPSELPSPSPTPETVRYATGTNLISPQSIGGRGMLSIFNGTESDAIAKIVDKETNKTRRIVYIRASSKAIISKIRTGDYVLKFCFGIGYDPESKKFLNAISFFKFDDILDFREERMNGVINWSDFEVTLNPVVSGTAQTSPITAADFEDY